MRVYFVVDDLERRYGAYGRGQDVAIELDERRW